MRGSVTVTGWPSASCWLQIGTTLQALASAARVSAAVELRIAEGAAALDAVVAHHQAQTEARYRTAIPARAQVGERVQILARLRALNANYHAKFSFPFILAVKGYDRPGVLLEFARRIENDRDAEFEAALSQIGRITRSRLDALLAE